MIRTEIVIAFLTLIVIGASLMLFFHLHPQNTPIPEPALAPSSTPAVAASTTGLILPAVSLEEKIGQLIMIGHWADQPLASTTDLIANYHLGSVIIMSAPEVASTTREWVATWQAVSSSTLLIGVDQEGGPVTRYKDGFIQTSQREIKDTATAYEVGTLRGAELSDLGINLNFAPVLDSATHPESFMYSRVFPNSSLSAELAAAMIEGMKENGVAAAPKHFPGHPDTSDDSHTTLPTADITLEELPEHTVIFTELFAAHTPQALMTAHVLFPKIDGYPATLSPFFLSTYLRDELGYQGVVITDDLSMDAIDNTWTVEAAAVQAIKAGADIVLLAAEPQSVSSVTQVLLDAVGAGTLPQTRIDESYDRVLKLKQTID